MKNSLSHEKKTFTYTEKSEQERAEFAARLKRVPENKRVYVDESGINTYLPREYARAPRGELIEETVPGKRFDRVNIIGTLCNGEHSAIECYRHTTHSGFFEDWCENNLLKEIPKGYTVIMYGNNGQRRISQEKRVAEKS